MSKSELSSRITILGFVTVAVLIMLLWSDPNTGHAQSKTKDAMQLGVTQAYRQSNYISDVAGIAFVQDPLLVNPWGQASSASSPFWVANNGSNTSTIYRSATPFDTVTANPGLSSVTIPGDEPTGTVFNTTASDFVLPGACAMPPCKATFLFASITGNITGWNPNAPAASSTTAVIAASHPGHVYTGLAIGTATGGNRLYAADFANGNIDVYDGTFALTTTTGGFADPTIPNTTGNIYHPFNVQALGGSLYVMYAKVDPVTGEEEIGAGKGYVRKFDMNGVKDPTFGIDSGPLNAPWGAALAPGGFGTFSGALIIGNFGEGGPSLNAFNGSGAFLGTLEDEGGDGIEIDELWSIAFGNGGNGGSPTALYFAAGPGEEEHGLFGALRPVSPSASLVKFSADEFEVNEADGTIDITVVRSGDTTGTASVNYAPFLESSDGHAAANDFTLAPGTLNFAPGDTAKTFSVAVTNDLSIEGDEELELVLSNPTTGAGLAQPNIVELTIHEVTVEVSGQVLTSKGQGLGNALVTMSDGQNPTRSVITGPFGFFRFDNMVAGHMYTVAVGSKRYDFTPQNVAVNDDVTDLQFTGTLH
jgi:uncharacterized protein (TIGR03118 family)